MSVLSLFVCARVTVCHCASDCDCVSDSHSHFEILHCGPVCRGASHPVVLHLLLLLQLVCVCLLRAVHVGIVEAMPLTCSTPVPMTVVSPR